MSKFSAQDDSGNFTPTHSERGRLAVLVLFQSIVGVLIVTALSFEFLAEELAKLYVVPILIVAAFTQFTAIGVAFKFWSSD